ncbi:hypothetical protein DY000_02031358 [Brassica cretica]|uniref:Uncharacterized protein n=1 Tax=Brassica cretica TaxID=69181 RepID=A0ABQ7DUQ4_BRACR|nr:hypothetical protein DY000_02031358 [Brassica cretica]
MVAIIILRQDENGNLYDQDGHLLVKHEKLGEGDFEVESSKSFGRSQWCRPMSMDAHRLTDHDEDRSIEYSRNRWTSSAESTAECSAVRTITHEEFAEKHPHPPSPFYVKIDRPHEPAIDRQRETNIDRPPSPPIDRRAPLTYRVRLPSIDSNRINALRPPPKPLANPPEPTTNPSDTKPEPMQVYEATEGRKLRKRKEKIPKNLKREANEKEMDGFTKRVLRIPVEKPFDEVYYAHRLSNKETHLLFSEDPAHLEHSIRKDQHSTSLDAAAFTSTDSRTQPSTDTRPSSSTNLHRSTSINSTPLTSIDPQSRNMVAIVILRQDENGNLYDRDGHLRNATVVRQQVNLVELGNDFGYIAACHCGAEYETEYSESIDTHTISSIDSNESPTTDERYPTSLDGKQPVDHLTSTDQCYLDFAFQQLNNRERDDYSIGSWADIGFHESFAIKTVIPDPNENPTKEYDEDYWKERAIEITMHDDRYPRYSFNNTSPSSIDEF